MQSMRAAFLLAPVLLGTLAHEHGRSFDLANSILCVLPFALDCGSHLSIARCPNEKNISAVACPGEASSMCEGTHILLQAVRGV